MFSSTSNKRALGFHKFSQILIFLSGNTPQISSLAIEKPNQSDSTIEINGKNSSENQPDTTEVLTNGAAITISNEASGDINLIGSGDATLTNGEQLPIEPELPVERNEDSFEEQLEKENTKLDDDVIGDIELNSDNVNLSLKTDTEPVSDTIKASLTRRTEVGQELLDDLSLRTNDLLLTDDSELKVDLQEKDSLNESSLEPARKENIETETVTDIAQPSNASPELNILVTEPLSKSEVPIDNSDPSPPKASPRLLKKPSTDSLDESQSILKTAAGDLSMSQDELDESLNSYDPSTPLAVRTNKLVTVTGEPMKNSPSVKNEPTADMNVVHVKMSHKRQGSNVSIASLTERCREIKGEAVEHHTTDTPSAATNDTLLLGRDDTLEANIQQHTEPLTVEHHRPHSHDESDDDGKLYPVSPFPPPQTSIYSQRSISLSEFSLEQTQELGDEDEKLLEDMMDYDRIDVQNDLIESIDSITDVEDNDSPPPVNINNPDAKRKFN